MKRLVGLYPADWQARYGPEFEAILEARPPGARDRIDIVRGAIDARLHPQVPGTGDRFPTPRPISSAAPGLLIALGGIAWVLAHSIIATTGPLNADLDATPAIPFLAAALVLIPLGTTTARGDLPRPTSRRGGALNAGLLLSAFLVFVLPWLGAMVALLAAVALFALSSVYHVVAAARVGWIPRLLAGVVVVATLGLFIGFIPVIGLGAVRLFYMITIVPFGVAWALVGAFMVHRSRMPSTPEAGGP